ncbi:rRNA-processing protein UTP23 [Xylona heveae TC161]|uniref:Protein phosphatase n=1 Tax=Xylona heveae (strain CBS 132557 / TC161) TaxID=1328760 RepID=A0A165JEP5_XYLHT|nr:rRNA-processing protein UTP23 [Xylona heveae TC161]KZF26140.1 rRNA-processing protein UTP23 [Xylona heveae TC161]
MFGMLARSNSLTHRTLLRVTGIQYSPIFCRLVSTSEQASQSGKTTPLPDDTETPKSKSPFHFQTGYALFAKRPSRPFPPPFLSLPSGSFSDPLSTHHRSRDRRSYVDGEMIRGITNGDDAVLVQENFVGANDGVGAWATRPRGHAALWSRLILHFWALEVERDVAVTSAPDSHVEPDPVEYLQKAYEQTIQATSPPNQWFGTTTACAALLHHSIGSDLPKPVLYITNLGDSQILVIRPREKKIIFKTIEQWHWFDCPRQLGTNSPDTPRENAVMDKIEIEEGDVVLALSDGVVDNLWQHEVLESVIDSLRRWDARAQDSDPEDYENEPGAGMQFVAKELMKAARKIAQDPFAESPFMERAVEEGLAMEGGKLDDISVVAGLCKRR